MTKAPRSVGVTSRAPRNSILLAECRHYVSSTTWAVCGTLSWCISVHIPLDFNFSPRSDAFHCLRGVPGRMRRGRGRGRHRRVPGRLRRGRKGGGMVRCFSATCECGCGLGVGRGEWRGIRAGKAGKGDGGAYSFFSAANEHARAWRVSAATWPPASTTPSSRCPAGRRPAS